MRGLVLAVTVVCLHGIVEGIKGSEISPEVFKHQALSDIISNYYAYDPFNRQGRDYVPALPTYPPKPLPPYPSKPQSYKNVDEYYEKGKSLSYDELKSFYAGDDFYPAKPQKYAPPHEVARGSKQYQPPVYIPQYPSKPAVPKYRKARVEYDTYGRSKPYTHDEYRAEEPYYPNRYPKVYDFVREHSPYGTF